MVVSKPAPDIFLLAAEKLQLKPEDCYVLEDGLHGVQAGLTAVSYTHLDVYKRQILTWPLMMENLSTSSDPPALENPH